MQMIFAHNDNQMIYVYRMLFVVRIYALFLLIFWSNDRNSESIHCVMLLFRLGMLALLHKRFLDTISFREGETAAIVVNNYILKKYEVNACLPCTALQFVR